jgi:hypothetical protein
MRAAIIPVCALLVLICTAMNVPLTVYGFTITDRNAGLPFGVPSVRSGAPHADNQPTALDIMPNGTGTSSNGKAWMDVCNADLIGNESAPVGCVRLAAFSDHMELGVYAYNGASTVPLKIKFQGVTIGTLDSSGNLTVSGTVTAKGFVTVP